MSNNTNTTASVAPAIQFETWKTIELGRYNPNPESYIAALNNRRGWDHKPIACGMSKDLMSQPSFKVASRPEMVDLVLITPKMLGLDDTADISDINDRATSLGLELCPAEMGPALRLAHYDHNWENVSMVIHIGMTPVPGSSGHGAPYIFVLDHDGYIPMLSTLCGYLGGCPIDSLWVFVLPRQK